jgi:hypothetical protein
MLLIFFLCSKLDKILVGRLFGRFLTVFGRLLTKNIWSPWVWQHFFDVDVVGP